MKILPGILILMALILALGFFMHRQTVELSADLVATLELLRQKVEVGQWEEALPVAEELKRKWERTNAWWTPFMDHREIDDLDQSMVKVLSLVEVRRLDDLLVEINLAQRMAARILEKERPHLRNIF